MRKFLTFAAIAAATALGSPLVAHNPGSGAQSAARRMTPGGSLAWAKKNPKRIFKN